MARGWTPSSWNRAMAKRYHRYSKDTIKSTLEIDTMTLKAIETTYPSEGRKDYWVVLDIKDNYKDSIAEVYDSKDEANSRWLELKKKYF